MAFASDSALFTYDVPATVTREGMSAEYCIRPRRGNTVAVFALPVTPPRSRTQSNVLACRHAAGFYPFDAKECEAV